MRVSGLVGGHSGVEINKGRANANVLMGRLLRAMAAVTELRLVSAEGGSKGNAIPTAAAAVVTVADGSAARKAAETLAAEMKKEYRIADPGLTVAVETVETKSLPMDEVTTGKALCMLTCLPNGHIDPFGGQQIERHLYPAVPVHDHLLEEMPVKVVVRRASADDARDGGADVRL